MINDLYIAPMNCARWDDTIPYKDRWLLEHRYYYSNSQEHLWLLEIFDNLKEIHDYIDKIRVDLRKDEEELSDARYELESLKSRLRDLADGEYDD